MHRCLLICEILRNIYEFVLKTDLPALARTCRALSDPALDITWRRLWGSATLVKSTLPPHFWEEETYGPEKMYGFRNRTRKLQLRGMPLPRDWDRFTFYANRIREYSTRAESKELMLALYNGLSMYRPSTPLFPQLHELNWHVNYLDQLCDIYMYLGPSLRRLSLVFCVEMAMLDIESTFQRIYNNCPTLQHIGVEMCENNDPASPSAICRFIRPLQHLRTFQLECHSLEHQDVLSLSELPCLEDLTLQISFVFSGNGFFETRSSVANCDMPFQTLQKLHITSPSSNLCLTVLSLAQRSPLRTVHIDCTPEWTADMEVPDPFRGTAFTLETLQEMTIEYVALGCVAEIMSHIWLPALWKLNVEYYECLQSDHNADSLFKLLVRSCSPAALTYLTINSVDDFSGSDPCILDTALRPLFVFKKLQSVTILPGVILDVDDSFIEEMARAWKNLRAIVFGSDNRSDDESRITFDGLVSLGRLCPQLVSIALHLKTKPIPQASEYLADGWSPVLGVRSLTLRSPLSQDAVSDTAIFLSCMFPNLTEVHGSYWDNCLWLEVERLVLGNTKDEGEVVKSDDL